MSSKQILIGVSNLNEFDQRIRTAVKRLEAGLPPEEPIHRLYFMDSQNLFNTLSPKRMELLKFLRKHGPLSRRQIAIKLNRAYANVHEDVRSLTGLGLIKKNSDGKLFVPWDEITIALPLAA